MRLAALLDPHLTGVQGRIGIAVSGGGDSLALLDLCAALAPERILAVTLDHGLRPEAADEALMVAAYCTGKGITHQVLRWQGWDGKGNLQAQARAARYRIIADWARAEHLAEVWIAHSRDDVAETLLIRLGRAAGLDGLSQMAEVFERDGMRWRRPLLAAGRDELRAHLAMQGITWAEDPSNRDPHYARVRARQALEVLAPLGISAQSLARSAEALGHSRALIEEVMVQEWQSRASLHGGDLLLRLEGAGPEMARRLTLAALQWIGGGAWPVRQSALEALTRRLESHPHHTLGGVVVARAPMGLRFIRELQAVRDLRVPLFALWDGRWEVRGPEKLEPGLAIAALGAGIAECPDWRASGLPRRSLMAGPAVWQGDRLIAAPLARPEVDWSAKLRPSFASQPFAH